MGKTIRLSDKQKEVLKDVKNGNELLYNIHCRSFGIHYKYSGYQSILASTVDKLKNLGIIFFTDYDNSNRKAHLTELGKTITID